VGQLAQQSLPFLGTARMARHLSADEKRGDNMQPQKASTSDPKFCSG
jgi:hypothetical protein